MATQLLLVRHGQSVWNADGRWQGQADPPLSELGRDQAAGAASTLGAVDAIFSSHQRRAHETASIIAEYTGFGPVQPIRGLEERCVGPWSGLTRAEIERDFPGYLKGGHRPHGFESDQSLTERTRTAIDGIAALVPGGTALIVSHGGVIHNLELAFGLDTHRVPNLSGRVITIEGGRWVFGDPISLVEARTGGEADRL